MQVHLSISLICRHYESAFSQLLRRLPDSQISSQARLFRTLLCVNESAEKEPPLSQAAAAPFLSAGNIGHSHFRYPVPAARPDALKHIFHSSSSVLHTRSADIQSARSRSGNHPPPMRRWHCTAFPTGAEEPASFSIQPYFNTGFPRLRWAARHDCRRAPPAYWKP